MSQWRREPNRVDPALLRTFGERRFDFLTVGRLRRGGLSWIKGSSQSWTGVGRPRIAPSRALANVA